MAQSESTAVEIDRTAHSWSLVAKVPTIFVRPEDLAMQSNFFNAAYFHPVPSIPQKANQLSCSIHSQQHISSNHCHPLIGTPTLFDIDRTSYNHILH